MRPHGRVGELTTFVLLQRLLSQPELSVPVFAAGGIGPHTAAAAVAGGATGVVLDTQLALTTEGAAGLPGDVEAAIRAMDGSETTVVCGHRIYARPDLAPPQTEIAEHLGARGLRTQPLPIGQEGPPPRGSPRVTAPPARSSRPSGWPSPATWKRRYVPVH